MAQGPIRIHMNDGKVYTLESDREAIVSQTSAHVLHRSESDGRLRAMVLPLVTIAGVEPLEASA